MFGYSQTYSFSEKWKVAFPPIQSRTGKSEDISHFSAICVNTTFIVNFKIKFPLFLHVCFLLLHMHLIGSKSSFFLVSAMLNCMEQSHFVFLLVADLVVILHILFGLVAICCHGREMAGGKV